MRDAALPADRSRQSLAHCGWQTGYCATSDGLGPPPIPYAGRHRPSSAIRHSQGTCARRRCNHQRNRRSDAPGVPVPGPPRPAGHWPAAARADPLRRPLHSPDDHAVIHNARIQIRSNQPDNAGVVYAFLQTVDHGGNTQLPLASVRSRDAYPSDRLWPIGTLEQLLPAVRPGPPQVLGCLGNVQTVDTRRSLIGLHARPCPLHILSCERLLKQASPCAFRFLFIGSRFTLHASSPRSVTLPQLRFTSFAVASSREDLHLQECARAGRTKKKHHGRDSHRTLNLASRRKRRCQPRNLC